MRNQSKIFYAFSGLIIFSLLFFGCGPKLKKIPLEYLGKKSEMAIEIKNVPMKPKLITGDGGIIGTIVDASRQSELRDKLQGIDGATFKEILQQKIGNRLESHFDIIGLDENPKLIFKVIINQWGWSLPTGAFGIKTGAYSFLIRGEVIIEHISSNNSSPIAYYNKVVQTPIGNDPTSGQIRDAMLKCSDEFSELVITYLINKK